MKNLVLGSLIALTATQAAGCIIENNGGPEDAFITASWTFRNEASGTTTGCPVGYNTVALYSQTTDGGYCDPLNPGAGNTCIDLFDCAAGSGVSSELVPTKYLSWIEVTSGSGGSVYAKSASAFVDVTVADKSFAAQILNDGGYFQFAWNLYDSVTNVDLNCSAAPGGVDLTATVSGGSFSNSDVFDCIDGSGITAGYPAATYTVSVAALNAAEQAVGVAPEITNAVILPQNSFTNLGTIEIPID
jgi:hypothetical protein